MARLARAASTLLGPHGLVERGHANAGVDADDLDAGIFEAPPRLADPSGRELVERGQVDRPAQEADLDARISVLLRHGDDLIDVVVGTSDGAETE